MPKDALGKEFKIGQLVDLPLMGMYRGIVVNVIEAPRILPPGQQPFPPRLVIVVQLDHTGDLNGSVSNVYIVKDSSAPGPGEQPPSDDAAKKAAADMHKFLEMDISGKPQ